MSWVVTDANIYTDFNNGTFESGAGTVKTTSSSPATIGVATDQYFTGSKSYKASAFSVYTFSGDSAWRQVLRFAIPKAIISGKRYTVSFNMLQDTPSTYSGVIDKAVTLHCALLAGDTFPDPLISSPNYSNIVRNPNAWISHQFTFVAGFGAAANAAYLSFWWRWSISFQSGFNMVANSHMWIDDLTIVEETNVPDVPPVISYTKTDVSVYGGANGLIDVSISGGSGVGFLYKWADGPTTQDRFGLPAGSYTLTVTDAGNGLKDTKTIIISQPAQLDITRLSTNPTAYGATDGTITIFPSGGSGVYTYKWDDGPTTKNRTLLGAGVYGVTVTDTLTGVTAFKDTVLIAPPAPPALNVSYTKVDVSSYGLSDGSIDVSVSGGTGPYTYKWLDGPTIQDRSGIKAGIYQITVTDSSVSAKIVVVSITILQPDAPPPPPVETGNLLQVPLPNTLMFIIKEDVDNVTVFQNPDNTLFCDQVFPGFECVQYFQKVCKSDSPVVQFNSNFPNHDILLKDLSTDDIIKGFEAVLKEQNIANSQDYEISIRNDIDNPGKSRIYFTVGAIPIPLSVDDHFEILNNSDGFNGIYAITSIQQDSILGYQYIVINKNYGISANSSTGTGRFDVTTEDFNVFESIIDLNDIADGEYYIDIIASDNEGNEKVATSEPIDLKVTHPNTICIEYRNTDNAYDITWTTGYTGKIRIEGILGHKRLPGGERSVSRDSDYSLRKINAKKTRGFLLETFMLPPYLHEKLSVIFDTDYWKVNGVQYQSTDGYDDPKYIDRFKLANSGIKIEQVTWFGKYNSTDLGTVSDEGFISNADDNLMRI